VLPDVFGLTGTKFQLRHGSLRRLHCASTASALGQWANQRPFLVGFKQAPRQEDIPPRGRYRGIADIESENTTFPNTS